MGLPKSSDFEVVATFLDPGSLAEGDVVVKNLYLQFDAAMRVSVYSGCTSLPFFFGLAL